MTNHKLKGYRVSKGLNQQDMGDIIQKTRQSYSLKERGVTEFTFPEAATIAVTTDMDLDTFNDIFFDGNLPFGKSADKELGK